MYEFYSCFINLRKCINCISNTKIPPPKPCTKFKPFVVVHFMDVSKKKVVYHWCSLYTVFFPQLCTGGWKKTFRGAGFIDLLNSFDVMASEGNAQLQSQTFAHRCIYCIYTRVCINRYYITCILWPLVFSDHFPSVANITIQLSVTFLANELRKSQVANRVANRRLNAGRQVPIFVYWKRET